MRGNPVDVRRESSLALWVKTNCRCDRGGLVRDVLHGACGLVRGLKSSQTGPAILQGCWVDSGWDWPAGACDSRPIAAVGLTLGL